MEYITPSTIAFFRIFHAFILSHPTLSIQKQDPLPRIAMLDDFGEVKHMNEVGFSITGNRKNIPLLAYSRNIAIALKPLSPPQSSTKNEKGKDK